MAKGSVVIREKFILCTFPLMFRGRPYVLEQSDNLSKLFSKIPEHAESEDETLCVCEVIGSRWRLSPSDPSDAQPVRTETLFQVYKYAEVSEDSDDEDEITDPAEIARRQRAYLRDTETEVKGI